MSWSSIPVDSFRPRRTRLRDDTRAGPPQEDGRLRRLVVSGCMVQRFADEMKRRLPEVDRFLGLNDVERVVEACDLADAGFIPDLGPAVYLPDETSGRMLATTGASAYLKIAEGCDQPLRLLHHPEDSWSIPLAFDRIAGAGSRDAGCGRRAGAESHRAGFHLLRLGHRRDGRSSRAVAESGPR